MKLRFLPKTDPMPRCEGIFLGSSRCRRNAVIACEEGHKFCKEHAIDDVGDPEVVCLLCMAGHMLDEAHAQTA